MNPILRAAANGLSRSRSEGQIRLEKQRAMQKQKRKQEKEKRRVDALEREEKWMALGKNNSKTGDGEVHEESAAEKFQKELCWCIQQLEMGLANMKPNARQAQEAEKVLRVLKSPKAPIAKKRQVMRSTFGDYRNKMLQEEKKHASVMASKTNISTVPQKTVQRATFYRRAAIMDDYQRSTSLPESFVPSLTPTEEEAALASPAGDSSPDGHHGDNKSIDEGVPQVTGPEIFSGGVKCGGKSKAQDPDVADKENVPLGEGEDNKSRNSTDGNRLESPIDSIVSTQSSDSADPPSSSEHSSQTGSSFRFDFQIDEDGEVVEVELVTGNKETQHSKTVLGKDDDVEKEAVQSSDNKSVGEGDSPIIGELPVKEGKKRRRNRKKKKGKESAEGLNTVKESPAPEGVEVVPDNDKPVELSVGGGEFKFNFDMEKK